MPGFFGDWSSPRSEIIEPRANLRLNWYYYIESGDNPIVYYKVFVKESSIVGWTDPAVKMWQVVPTQGHFDVPPYTMELNKTYVWRVEAWAIDRRYNPNAPDPQYEDPDYPTPETIISGVPFLQGDNNNAMDASGWAYWSEPNWPVSVVNVPAPDGIPPGEYEYRIKSRNGFAWSDWSTTGIVKAYDTRKFHKRTNIWGAVPVKKKNGGTWEIVVQ